MKASSDPRAQPCEPSQPHNTIPVGSSTAASLGRCGRICGNSTEKQMCQGLDDLASHKHGQGWKTSSLCLTMAPCSIPADIAVPSPRRAVRSAHPKHPKNDAQSCSGLWLSVLWKHSSFQGKHSPSRPGPGEAHPHSGSIWAAAREEIKEINHILFVLSKHSLESHDSALHLLLPSRKPRCWLLWWLQGTGSPGLA